MPMLSLTRAWLASCVIVLMCLAINISPADATEEDSAGVVVRQQGNAVAMQDAIPRILKVGAKIRRGDVISTGKGARLEVRMLDNAVLTLGESTVFVVVDYVFNGQDDNALFRLMQGAFKATSGKIVAGNSGPMQIATEVATIGIRGTTAWGGFLDNVFEVALLDGKGIYVETKRGHVELTKAGQGSKITSADQPPSNPVMWKQAKTDRAVATVTFD